MLIITRSIGSAFTIGEGDDQALVVVLGISGNQVRIGIEADPSIPIKRDNIKSGKEQGDE